MVIGLPFLYYESGSGDLPIHVTSLGKDNLTTPSKKPSKWRILCDAIGQLFEAFLGLWNALNQMLPSPAPAPVMGMKSHEPLLRSDIEKTFYGSV